MAEIDKNDLPLDLLNKLTNLENYIKALGSLAVGFSGGVDSTFLLTVAHNILGDKAIAVTEAGAMVPRREIKEASDFCRERGIAQYICEFDPLTVDEFRMNGKERCYYCKRAIFSEIKRIADDHAIEYIAEGSNMDDLGDYRPGLKAVAEMNIKSPLREAGLYKEDIRLLSKAMGLPTWSKPSYACLASRFVYGEEITKEKLMMIDKAEQFLIEHGFLQERVRIHGLLARIEVSPKDIQKLASDKYREEVYREFKKIGFTYVSLDMKGYRTGSMNETLGN